MTNVMLLSALVCALVTFACIEAKHEKYYCHPVCEHRCLPTCKLQCCLPKHENPLYRSYMPHSFSLNNVRSFIRHPVMKQHFHIPEDDLLQFIVQRREMIFPRTITPEQLEKGDICTDACQVECRPNCKFRCCLNMSSSPRTRNDVAKKKPSMGSVDGS